MAPGGNFGVLEVLVVLTSVFCCFGGLSGAVAVVGYFMVRQPAGALKEGK